MIYDYEDQEGYVSLWIGQCSNYQVIDEYLSTVYLEGSFDGDIEKAEQNEFWKKRFLPENRSRACEEELKDHFHYETFNQFEYDFGLTFDEDFREANVLDSCTGDLEKLFGDFSESSSFLDAAKAIVPRLPECNTAVALYDFKYEGGIAKASHENITLFFAGYFPYDK